MRLLSSAWPISISPRKIRWLWTVRPDGRKSVLSHRYLRIQGTGAGQETKSPKNTYIYKQARRNALRVGSNVRRENSAASDGQGQGALEPKGCLEHRHVLFHTPGLARVARSSLSAASFQICFLSFASRTHTFRAQPATYGWLAMTTHNHKPP